MADWEQQKPLDQSIERLEEALARVRESDTLEAHAKPAALVPAQSTAAVASKVGIPSMAVLLVVLLAMGATSGYFFIAALLPGLF